jgi:hypothetical protein
MSDIVVYGARDCPARDSVSLAALKKNKEEQPRPVMTSNRPGFFVTTIGGPGPPECRIETWALMQLVKGIAANGFSIEPTSGEPTGAFADGVG